MDGAGNAVRGRRGWHAGVGAQGRLSRAGRLAGPRAHAVRAREKAGRRKGRGTGPGDELGQGWEGGKEKRKGLGWFQGLG